MVNMVNRMKARWSTTRIAWWWWIAVRRWRECMTRCEWSGRSAGRRGHTPNVAFICKEITIHM